MGSVHLDGAEDVRRAGGAISGAAETMARAASTFDTAAERLILNLSGVADRMEEAARRMEAAATLISTKENQNGM